MTKLRHINTTIVQVISLSHFSNTAIDNILVIGYSANSVLRLFLRATGASATEKCREAGETMRPCLADRWQHRRTRDVATFSFDD